MAADAIGLLDKEAAFLDVGVGAESGRTLRRHMEKNRLWHDPRRRQCGLASLTSFHFDGGQLTGIGYREPAAHLVAKSRDAGTAKGA